MKLEEITEEFWQDLKFDSRGLLPAIVQEKSSGRVLMLAYMDKEAVKRTLETGQTWFYSRSRQELWHKGETSGHFQDVLEFYYDCDGDTILVKVHQTGDACHEGYHSCFSRRLNQNGTVAKGVGQAETLAGVLADVFQTIKSRQVLRPEGSYTSYLFNEGQDKILKKVGEEAAETIIASKNNENGEVCYEMADLIYHCLVLLAYHGLTPQDIALELSGRR